MSITRGSIQRLPKDKTPYCRECGVAVEGMQVGSWPGLSEDAYGILKPCGCQIPLVVVQSLPGGNTIYDHPDWTNALDWRQNESGAPDHSPLGE